MQDPKLIKALTSSEAQSKSSHNSSSFYVSDAQTNINLNANTYDIPDDIEEISPHADRLDATKRNVLKLTQTKLIEGHKSWRK